MFCPTLSCIQDIFCVHTLIFMNIHFAYRLYETKKKIDTTQALKLNMHQKKEGTHWNTRDLPQ